MADPAQLYTPFVEQIGNLQTEATNIAESNQGDDQRTWRIPELWTGDPLDIPAFKPPFDREKINEAYQDFFSGADNRVADTMAAKLQGDHLGAQERAFRLRHASHIRCTMHAANRRGGHGKAAGGLFARISEHIQDVILSRNAGG